ncbi:MAG: hypothetical protein WBA45_08290 [Microthrixaceae bacterium]
MSNSANRLSKRQTRRSVDRDALALAAWPWLPLLGSVIDETLPPSDAGRPRTFNGASLLLLVALRWRAKSLDHAEEYLKNNWDKVRLHGLEHNCRLPEKPPRWEHLRLIRHDERFPELLEALDGPFIDAGLGTAEAIGLLPETNPDIIIPRRSTHLQGDGTTAKHMTAVTEVDGKVRGSRATRLQPRFSETLITTKNGKKLTGYPIIAWDVRGDRRWERVVLNISPHPDGDEVTVAEAALMRILDRTDRVRTIGYDQLLMGAAQGRIMRHGALPIVERAQPNHSLNDPRKVVTLPSDLVPQRGSKNPAPPGRGKGRRNRGGDAPSEKRRLAVAQLPDAEHDTPNGPCRHQIATIDACLVVHDGGSDRDWWHRTEVPPISRVEHIRNTDGSHTMIGVWKIRCEHMDRANRLFEYRLELSGKIGKFETPNRVNAYPYVHPQSSGLYGWRNDIESFFRWFKGQMTSYGKSTSLRYLDFIFDALGAGILNNAIAFDLHGRGTP